MLDGYPWKTSQTLVESGTFQIVRIADLALTNLEKVRQKYLRFEDSGVSEKWAIDELNNVIEVLGQEIDQLSRATGTIEDISPKIRSRAELLRELRNLEMKMSRTALPSREVA